MIKIVLIIVIVSYLLGSIPFGYLLVRIFRKEDVRLTGSGNIGATNVARTGSKGLAIATLLLDALKGYAAVLWIAGALVGQSTSAYDRHVGHGRRDGGPVATALAAFVAIPGICFPSGWVLRVAREWRLRRARLPLWRHGPCCCLWCFRCWWLRLSRYVSLGSMVAAASFPFCVYVATPPERTNLPVALLMRLSSLLIIVRHKDNIRRLVAGTENRFR